MVCETAYTGTLPRAYEGFWMTLGECMKFQSRQMGRAYTSSRQFLVLPNTIANTTVVCVPPRVLSSPIPSGASHIGDLCIRVL